MPKLRSSQAPESSVPDFVLVFICSAFFLGLVCLFAGTPLQFAVPLIASVSLLAGTIVWASPKSPTPIYEDPRS